MLFRGLLFAAISFSVLGQVPAGDYEALKHALGLEDAQLQRLQQRRQQLQQRRPLGPGIYRGDRMEAARVGTYMANRPTQTEDSLRDRILDDSQRAKLAVIEKGLNYQTAAEAIVLGLISVEQWPGGLCFYPISSYTDKRLDALELGLTDSQVRQLEQLERAAREPFYTQIKEKEKRRSELSTSGIPADSPVIVQ